MHSKGETKSAAPSDDMKAYAWGHHMYRTCFRTLGQL